MPPTKPLHPLTQTNRTPTIHLTQQKTTRPNSPTRPIPRHALRPCAYLPKQVLASRHKGRRVDWHRLRLRFRLCLRLGARFYTNRYRRSRRERGRGMRSRDGGDRS